MSFTEHTTVCTNSTKFIHKHLCLSSDKSLTVTEINEQSISSETNTGWDAIHTYRSQDWRPTTSGCRLGQNNTADFAIPCGQRCPSLRPSQQASSKNQVVGNHAVILSEKVLPTLVFRGVFVWTLVNGSTLTF